MDSHTIQVVWVQWTPKPGDRGETMPRAARSHAAWIAPVDVANGSFPLLCGRWAPNGYDADLVQTRGARPCRRCAKAVDRKLAHRAAQVTA